MDLTVIKGKLVSAAYHYFNRLPPESLRPGLEAQGFKLVDHGGAAGVMIEHPSGGILAAGYSNPACGYDMLATFVSDKKLYKSRWKDLSRACTVALRGP